MDDSKLSKINSAPFSYVNSEYILKYYQSMLQFSKLQILRMYLGILVNTIVLPLTIVKYHTDN
jgi:hypothetical protein